jgi:acyl-CoA thioesterase I
MQLFSHKAKNIQSILKAGHGMELKLLKFCYFIIPLLLLSCGNTNNTEEKEEPAAATTTNTTTEESTDKTILFFGDSITAGYGLEDSKDAFPSIIQSKIDSLGLAYEVINSGVSGETTAGGKSRIAWVLNQDIDIFILELGANDGLRGVPLSETRANLQDIIDAVRDANPETTIILAGMELPPNMGQEYTSEFRSIYADLAKKNDLKFIPFILKGVGGVPELNQSDGIHPTAEGHKIIARTVWEVLKEVLK